MAFFYQDETTINYEKEFKLHFPHLMLVYNHTSKQDYKVLYEQHYKREYRIGEGISPPSLTKQQIELLTLIKKGKIEEINKLRNSISITDLLAQDFRGLNALHWAKKLKHQNILNFLYEIMLSKIDNTTVQNACKNSFFAADTEVMKRIYCNISCHQPWEKTSELLKNHRLHPFAFIVAAMYGEVEGLEWIRQRSHNEILLFKDEKNDSPIFTAIKYGQIEAFNYLKKYENIEENFLIGFVAKHKQIEILSSFPDKYVVVQSTDIHYVSALHAAIGNNDLAMAVFLVNNGAKVNKPGPNQFTPLHLAMVDSDSDVIKFLLERGADPELKDYDQRTPLQSIEPYSNIQTRYQLNIDTLKKYISNNNNNNNNSPQTPLDYNSLCLACEKNNLDFIKNHITVANINNQYGPCKMSLLHIVVQSNAKEIAKYLLLNFSNVIKINAQDASDETPLHVAVIKSRVKGEQGDIATEICRLLVQYGASTDICNKLKKSPMDYAKIFQKEEILIAPSRSKTQLDRPR